jgi:hypothetical protein
VKSPKFKVYRFVFFAAVFISWQLVSHAQTVSINEFMASNASTIADEDGDFEDWIEILNYGDEPVHLEGWFLSDDFSDPCKWMFPDTVIHPSEFLLVWASGKDRTENFLHTNFSIDASGEELLLVNPSGNWVDVVNPIDLPTNISHGRQPDGAGDWYYFKEPTPQLPNVAEGFHGILPPLEFSHPGGFYDEEFLLELTHPDNDVVIYYTLDGSEPDDRNIHGVTYQYKNRYSFYANDPVGELLDQQYKSFLYDDPVQIINRSGQPDKLAQMSSTVQDPDYFPDDPVFKGTVLRAVALKEGFLPSDVKTHTYFISSDVTTRFSLPVISLAIQEDVLFDYEKGIYTAGADADKWREENPGKDFTWPFAGNWRRRGLEWEYPANFEYFEKGHLRHAVNQQVGIRLHGGATRSFPMKSLRIYARNMYGESYLNHSFFENNPHDAFKRLILRNSGNDFPTNIWEPDLSSRTLFRDAAIQKIVKHLNIDTQDYSPVVVFINGEYWGIHNIRERYDKHYIERVYDAPAHNIDLLSGHGDAIEGTNTFYSETIAYIKENDLEEAEHFNYIETRIDIENFLDFQIAHIFSRNTDWPGNNVDYWRLRTENYIPDAPYGHDGRLRWLLYDTDFGFGLWGGSKSWEHNTLDFATQEGNTGWPNPDWGTFLLRSLLKNQMFSYQFINRFSDLLNTSFLPQYTTGIIHEIRNTLSPEIEKHISRWKLPENITEWEKNVDVMDLFALKRPSFQRNHIKEFFDLQGTYSIELDVSNLWHGYIKINTIQIEASTPGVPDEPYPWEGIYFKDIPISVIAVPAPGYRFSHWEGDYSSSDSIIQLTPSANLKLKAVFAYQQDDHLLNFWMFDDNLPNDLPLEEVKASYNLIENGVIEYRSCLPDYPYDPGHPLWRKASMERRHNPTPLNYRQEGNKNIIYEASEMKGIQVKRPFVEDDMESALIFHLPTSRARNLFFRFAAIDEGAADALIVDYSVTPEVRWVQHGLNQSVLTLSELYMLYEVDFSEIDAVNDNPDFKVRIRFAASNSESDNDGRVSFNNFSLDGEICMAYSISTRKSGPGVISPSGIINMVECGSISFTLIPEPNHVIGDLTLDGISIFDELMLHEDLTGTYILKNPVANHVVEASFDLDPFMLNEDEDLIIYPNPFNYLVNIASVTNISDVEIFDLTGRKVYSATLNKKQAEIDLSHLNTGIYIARVFSEEGVSSRKIHIIRE